MSQKTYFDLTGLFHNNSDAPSGISRIEEMVARQISIMDDSDYRLVSWTSSANKYIELSVNLSAITPKQIFAGKSSLKYSILDIVTYSIRRLVEYRIIGGLLNKYFKIIKAVHLSDKIMILRSNKIGSFRSYIESKSRVTESTIEIQPGDKVFIINQSYVSNSEYMFFLLRLYYINNVALSVLLFNPLVSIQEEDKQVLKKFSIAFFLKNKIPLICCSDFIKNELGEYINRNTISYEVPLKKIQIPLDYLNVEKSKIIMPLRPFALTVGMQTSRKNHLFLIKLWNYLWNDNVENLPDLVIVGKEGDVSQHIAQNIRKLDAKLQEKIHIYTDIRDSELFTLYSNCKFTLYPSSFDPVAFPVLESQYFNKPCICNTGSGLDYVVNDISKNIPINDVQGWINCINDFIVNSDFEKKSRESILYFSAKEFVSELISDSGCEQGHFREYNRVIEKIYKPVNIVLADRSWILEELANKIAMNLDYVAISDKPDLDSKINYYINYSSFKTKTPNIDIGFFTHIEEFSTAAYERFFEVAQKVDFSICMSQKYQAIIESKNFGKKVYTITPGVDQKHFVPKLKVGICGRTYPSGRKGEKLIEQIYNEPWIEWHFTGEGWPGPSHKLSNADMPNFYRSIDVLLIPSLYEGGPMPLIEALACGTRVVSSNVGFANEFPHIEFINGDIQSMKNALQIVYNEKLILRNSILALTWENWANKHDILFKDILEKMGTN